TMKKLLILAVAGAVIYFVATPYITAARLALALNNNEQQTIEQLVDFPSLRINLALNVLGQNGSHLATTALVQLLEVTLTPATIGTAIHRGKVLHRRATKNQQESPDTALNFEVIPIYTSVNSFSVSIAGKDQDGPSAILILEREDWLSPWKLTNIEQLAVES
ncbi:MAG: DUF2939 domain-containing protein, partial [Gammaproteobacteria bacterium]